jgi:hypothetical protein
MDAGELGWQAAQLLGAGMILGAYVLLQTGALGARSRPYLGLSAVGAGTLALIALVESLWGFLLLEGTWPRATKCPDRQSGSRHDHD